MNFTKERTLEIAEAMKKIHNYENGSEKEIITKYGVVGHKEFVKYDFEDEPIEMYTYSADGDFINEWADIIINDYDSGIKYITELEYLRLRKNTAIHRRVLINIGEIYNLLREIDELTDITHRESSKIIKLLETTVMKVRKDKAHYPSQVVQDVIRGVYGVGTERTDNLHAAGLIPDEVQREVNEYLSRKSTPVADWLVDNTPLHIWNDGRPFIKLWKFRLYINF